MSADVWWTTLISIPVSIAVAMAVPRIQRWVDQRGKTTHAKKLERMREEYDEVLFYALHTDLMNGKLIISVLLLLVLVAFSHLGEIVGTPLGVTTAILLPPPALADHKPLILIAAISFLIALWTAAFVALTRYAGKHLRLFLNVKNFRIYAESIPAELRDRDMEEIVIAASRDRAVPGLYTLRSIRLKSDGLNTQIDASPNQTESPPDRD
jgi:hypothetical protein